MSDSPQATGAAVTCPSCGAAADADASFCEACGAVLAGATSSGSQSNASEDGAQPGGAQPGAPPGAPDEPALAAATPQTAAPGRESPLDVGWTGPVVPSAPSYAEAEPSGQAAGGGAGTGGHDVCRVCGLGKIVDGYCDQCGSPPADPRDHFTESPSAWVGGACDIGRRHSRNEDALALDAAADPGSRAVLVVCDGVSNTTDSHIASLVAARAARAALQQPFARGVGTQDAWAAAAGRSLDSAVMAANQAVCEVVPEGVANPPSSTFAAAVIEDASAAVGTVGDSRVYWLPDDQLDAAVQMGHDDSYAAEEMARGVPRAEAEDGPKAHSITRWLGRDAPDDLTPRVTTQDVGRPGWLLVCSDGLWNYCSEAEALRELVQGTLQRMDQADPSRLAEALVEFANDQGGQDNITVALARLPGQGSRPDANRDTTAQANRPATLTSPPEKGDQTDG